MGIISIYGLLFTVVYGVPIVAPIPKLFTFIPLVLMAIYSFICSVIVILDCYHGKQVLISTCNVWMFSTFFVHLCLYRSISRKTSDWHIHLSVI